MSRTHRRRRRDDRGAAIVEFAIVVPLLGLVLFGVIEFGFILAYKHSVSQAASEGARAALIDYTSSADMTSARGEARTRAAAAMNSWETTCDEADGDGDGFGCRAYTHDCSYPIDGVLPAGITQGDIDTVATPDCITVVVTHDYDAAPLLPPIPVLSLVLPDEIESVSTIQVTE